MYLRSKIEIDPYMRYGTEIIHYTLHIFFMNTFALKKKTMSINIVYVVHSYRYLGDEFFYDEEKVCPDL